METKNSISSKALEANLAKTRGSRVELPADHKWLLSVTEEKYGIHKRALQFFYELNHPYSNLEWLSENIKAVAVQDLWVYTEHQEAEKSLTVFVSVFDKLLFSECSRQTRESFTQAAFQFLEALLSHGDRFSSIVSCVIADLKSYFHQYSEVFIFCSGYLKHLAVPKNSEKLLQDLIELGREVVIGTADYWAGSFIDSDQGIYHPAEWNQIEKLDSTIGSGFLENIREQARNAAEWQEITSIPFHRDIAAKVREFSVEFNSPADRVFYLISLLRITGMEPMLDLLLWDINRLLPQAFSPMSLKERCQFLDTFFELFESLRDHHAGTVLGCIETLGDVVNQLGQEQLISHFVSHVVSFRFICSEKPEIGDQWQLESDPNHIRNIRTWMHLFEMNPDAMSDILASLVIHLRIGGIFIQDTDLFQKDVTRLLNSNISNHYKMIKHLAILFPVFFSEIGAEGELRDATTALDEINERRDTLIHFFRKQVHVESNNTHADLALEILKYWYSKDYSGLIKYLPADVKAFVQGNNKYIEDINEVLLKLKKETGMEAEDLVESGINAGEKLRSIIDEEKYEQSIYQIELLVRLCRILQEKYSVYSGDVLPVLRKSGFFNTRIIDRLGKHLGLNQHKGALKTIYELMYILKDVILDPKESEGWENIYYKRHIAAGIPSMYGFYKEKKFEALGLTLKLEHTADRLITNIINNINLEYITVKTLRKITVVLDFFEKGLKVRGIISTSFASNVQMLSYSLKSGSFSIDQYINIFTMFTKDIQEIINRYFIDVYDRALEKILPRYYTADGSVAAKGALKEEFYRDLLASAFLIQKLDTFVSRIIEALTRMRLTLPNDILLKIMSYDSDTIMAFLHGKSSRIENKVFLGAKAYYLRKLAQLGYRIPSGFVFTTELFRNRDCILKYSAMEAEIDTMMKRGIEAIERRTALTFGSPSKPLLLSVRSGSAFSMPGAMDTILNVGLNRSIAEEFGADEKYSWIAWDCYRRLLQSWGMLHDIHRDDFDRIINEMKQKIGIERKKDFNSEQMRILSSRYYEALRDNGVDFPENPLEQLKVAVLKIMNSWFSGRVKFYRRHLQIADEWGTAITVQRMVFGNLNDKSGTGVVFTRDPLESSDTVTLTGDYILRSQGEDVVSGLVHTLPVSRNQSTDSEKSLEHRFPSVYRELLSCAKDLVKHHGYPHQEIEFTFESPKKVYILQARPQSFHGKNTMNVFDLEEDTPVCLGQGIGAGGGALNGIAVFDRSDIEWFSQKEPEASLVLLRPDTVPEDLELVYFCSGLLTSRGGITSHAAVTASQLGKVCVVNCRDLAVNEREKTAELNGTVFVPGSKIARLGYIASGYAPSPAPHLNR